MYDTKNKFKALLGHDGIVILGIETSCDETAAAVTRGCFVLSSVIASQAKIHQKFGGVVPEVASRNHMLDILNTVDKALKDAGVALNQVDAIAVVHKPGLIGSLLVGVSTAKALAFSHNIPLIKVNHIEAHIAACFADKGTEELKHPFLAVVASGGHTTLFDVTGHNKYEKIGGTTDDAIGEAFDKVARVLGLDYPGGPEVDKRAKQGEPYIQFIKSKGTAADLSLSYSGLKTAVVNYVNKLKQKGDNVPIDDICASFNKQAADILIKAVLKAAQSKRYDTIVLAGGVAANSYLRAELTSAAKGFNVVIPPLNLCGDNAVMVAVRGYLSAHQGHDLADLDLTAQSVS